MDIFTPGNPFDHLQRIYPHYNDVIMSTMASQITSLTSVYSTVYSGADERKHQSSASLVFVRGIHRWPVNSPHKGPVMRKMSPFDDVIMGESINSSRWALYFAKKVGVWVTPAAWYAQGLLQLTSVRVDQDETVITRWDINITTGVPGCKIASHVTLGNWKKTIQ